MSDHNSDSPLRRFRDIVFEIYQAHNDRLQREFNEAHVAAQIAAHFGRNPAMKLREEEAGFEGLIALFRELQAIQWGALRAGCRLGESPSRMGQILDDLYECCWDMVFPRVGRTDESKSGVTVNQNRKKMYQALRPLEYVLAVTGEEESPAMEQKTGEVLAVQILFENTSLTRRELAKRLGVSERATHNWKRVNDFFAARRASRQEQRKGFRRPGGQIEAID